MANLSLACALLLGLWYPVTRQENYNRKKRCTSSKEPKGGKDCYESITNARKLYAALKFCLLAPFPCFIACRPIHLQPPWTAAFTLVWNLDSRRFQWGDQGVGHMNSINCYCCVSPQPSAALLQVTSPTHLFLPLSCHPHFIHMFTSLPTSP